jgi:phosphorylase kinase alpha/beta subunit
MKTAVIKSEVEALIAQGTVALNRILLWECIQSDPSKQRRYDAALLFLADPLEIVSEEMTDTILTDVAGNLQGAFGISRYPKDSYWGPDYRQLPADKRTIDLSDHMSQRDVFAVPGEEAEWCIFDTIVSLIHGKKYRKGRDPRELANQVTYLNRGLRQLVELDTAPGRVFLPEAYFVEKGRYVPNDHLPLQWAHANLWRAVVALMKNISLPP